MSKYNSLLILLLLFACAKTNDNPATLSNSVSGDYSGTFNRTNSKTGTCCDSEVTLSLTDSTFMGNSEHHHLPAICSGNIDICGAKIIFHNECVWPANFDWSLILSEEWNYELSENKLKLWKERGNIKDEYLLKKN